MSTREFGLGASEKTVRNDGKELERLAYFIQQATTPGAKVTLGDSIKGRKSKVQRQLDITVRVKAGLTELLIVVECKDHAQRIDVKEVESFLGALKDVGANKGIMVSRKGFTDAAKNWAREVGLDLYGLDDVVEEEKFETIEVPVLVEFVGMSTVHFSMSGSSPVNMADILMPGKVKSQDLPLYSLDGRFQGTAGNVLRKKWNEGAISRTPTPDPASLFQSTEFAVKDPEKEAFYPISIGAAIWIRKDFFLGSLELEAFKYYRNELSGELVGKLFRSESFTYPMMERRWKKVEDPSTLKVKPSLIFSAEDYYHVS